MRSWHDPPSTAPAGPPTVAGMAPLPNFPTDPDDAPEAYVGLDAGAAADRARARGWATVRTLPPGAIITMEYQVGRLNFEVADDTVRRCWKG